jgi:DnaJ-domain-containing protein 1
MSTDERPGQSIASLFWETLRLSMRLLWKSSVNPVRPMLQRQQALAVLGLPSTATPQQIKRRYRVLAKKYHPDVGGDPQQMQRLIAAYEFLMKP